MTQRINYEFKLYGSLQVRGLKGPLPLSQKACEA